MTERDSRRVYRFLIVNEHYIGHTTVHRLFCRALASDPNVDFDPERDTIRLDRMDSLLERIQRRGASIRFPSRWVRRQDLDFHHWRFQRFLGRLARKRVLKKLEGARYDALAFHSQTAAYGSADLMRRHPTLISTDITNTQAAREGDGSLTPWTYLPSTRYERRVFERAKAIAVFSEWTRQATLRENVGMPPDKVRCYPPGADLKQLLGISLTRRSSPRLRLLFVGGDFVRKGGHDVLTVFRNERLHETCELDLVSYGAPPEAETLPGVRVHRHIQAYSPEWLERYALADVFVLPTHSEAYGHVFVEAMAAGLPVIATSINAIPEIVGRDGAQLLVPPGDRHALLGAIARLRANPELRQRLGAAGRDRAAAQFDAEVCFARYVEWLKAISHPSESPAAPDKAA